MAVLPRWTSSYLLLDGTGYARVECDGCINPLPDFAGTTPYTVTAWVRLDAYPAAGDEWVIVCLCDPAGLNQPQFKLVVESGGHVGSYRNSGTASTATLTLGAWNSVATTYNGAEVVVYVNGTPSDPYTDSESPFPPTGMAVDIGAENGSTVFTGGVARVQLWAGVALSEQEVVLESMQWTAQDDISNYPYLAASFDFTRLPLIDQSGSGLTCTLVGGATPYVSAPVLDLTAQGSYVDCGTNPALGFPDMAPYTVDGWLFLPGTTLPAGGQIVGQPVTEGSESDPQWWITCTQGVLTSFRYDPNTAEGSQVKSGALLPNVWYHFATTYDGEALRIWVNGNLQAVTPMSTLIDPASTQPVRIGTSPTSPTFGGYLQNLRIWSVALGEAAIRQWMYADPVDDPAMLAGVDVTSMTLLDSTGRNTVVLQEGATIRAPKQALDPQDMALGWLQPTLGVSLQEHLENVPVGDVGWEPPDMEPEELDWWVDFAYALTMGFFTKLFLVQSPGDLSERIYMMLSTNTAVWTAVQALVGPPRTTAITPQEALAVLQTIWVNNVMWPLLRAGFVSTGWLPLFLTSQVIGTIVDDDPDWPVASGLSGLPLWVDELNDLIAGYPSPSQPSGGTTTTA